MIISRGAIIILLINYCAFLFSQNPKFSREYESRKSNVPLKIINQHPDYFFVLRYNHDAHDFTVERRNKSDARIISFTPLKLDSLNARSFDYEKLDFLFFGLGHKVYFVFQKIENSRCAVYIKEIDTLGKAHGFRELAVLDKEAGLERINITFKLTQYNKLLVINEQYYYSNFTKKTALLYDPEKKQKVWVKKLPLENVASGFSSEFECTQGEDLYYTLQNNSIYDFQRRYINNAQVSVPLISCDSLWLLLIPAKSDKAFKTRIGLNERMRVNTISLFEKNNEISSLVVGSNISDNEKEDVFFMLQKFNSLLSQEIVRFIQPLDSAISKQLTFYDGTDENKPAYKEYKQLKSQLHQKMAYQMAGRNEDNSYNELLFWKINLENSRIVYQSILPRRLFYFRDRTRFHHLDEVSTVISEEHFCAFLLEHPANSATLPGSFKFKRFARQKYADGGNLVMYYLKPDKELAKKVIEKSPGFNFIPLIYDGNQTDFVYYLNRGKKERFAILQPSPF